jgi:hypothetical protein
LFSKSEFLSTTEVFYLTRLCFIQRLMYYLFAPACSISTSSFLWSGLSIFMAAFSSSSNQESSLSASDSSYLPFLEVPFRMSSCLILLISPLSLVIVAILGQSPSLCPPCLASSLELPTFSDTANIYLFSFSFGSF